MQCKLTKHCVSVSHLAHTGCSYTSCRVGEVVQQGASEKEGLECRKMQENCAYVMLALWPPVQGRGVVQQEEASEKENL